MTIHRIRMLGDPILRARCEPIAKPGSAAVRVVIDDLYTLSPKGRYYYTRGYNPVAIGATLIGAVVGVIIVFAASSDVAAYSWFICASIGFALHYAGTAFLKNSVPTDDLPAEVPAA